MGPSIQEAEERKQFFDHLFSLDDDDEDQPDNPRSSHQSTRSSRRLKRHKTTALATPSDPTKGQNHSPGLNRAHTAPLPQEQLTGFQQPDRQAVGSVQPIESVKPSADILPSGSDTGNLQVPGSLEFSPGHGRMNPPRSRKAKASVVPESRQIFRNLVFYFIPNDNVAPPRRMRIERAQQYGATWLKQWDGTASHVIVDKHLAFGDVLKHLKVDKPPSDIVFVNESYPPECISFSNLLDSSSSRFRITGQEQFLKVSEHPAKENRAILREPIQPLLESPEAAEPSHPLADEENLTSQSIADLGSEVADSEPDRNDCPLQSGTLDSDYADDLNEIIEGVKQMGDIPLDLEDDSTSGLNAANDTESTLESDEEDSPRPKKKSRKNTGPSNFSLFACMQKSEDGQEQNNPNAHTMEVLQQMATYYDRIGDNWRTRAYRRAITELRKQKTKIMTKEEAVQLPNVGGRIAEKIEEIAWTNRLRRLEATSLDPTDKILQLFMGIYGVGFSVATKWIAQGYRTLEDLKAKVSLSANQRIGIDHYDDFLQRIPRDEVAAHAEIVRREAMKEDAGIQISIGGSYRRGSADSGDIDLLITKDGASMPEIMSLMLPVISRLRQNKFLVAVLSTGGISGSKWHGASCLPGSMTWRRIDLLFVPWNELGAALIYFTGNDIFNRSIRLLASRKKMRLNQHGLYSDVIIGPGRTRMTDGKLLEGHDEMRIFELLGVPYRPPEHRIC